MNVNWLDDARKIPDETMFYIRVMAATAIRERGYSPEQVAELLNIDRTSIYDWLKRYDKGGYAALQTRLAPGAAAIVTEEMDEWLAKVVLTRTPNDFGYDTNLWTCSILAELMERKYNVRVSDCTIGLHLKENGLSCQKPNYKIKKGSRRDRAFLKGKNTNDTSIGQEN